MKSCIVWAVIATAFLGACQEKTKPEQFAGVDVKATKNELEEAGFSCRANGSEGHTKCVKFDGNSNFMGYPVQEFIITYRQGVNIPFVFTVKFPNELAAGAPIGKTAELIDRLNSVYVEDPKGMNSDNAAMFLKGWRNKAGSEIRLTIFKGVQRIMLPTVAVSYFPDQPIIKN